MTSAATGARWEAPEPVDLPSLDGFRSAYGRLNLVSGMRTAGWVCLGLGLLAVLAGLLLGWVEFSVVGISAVVVVALALLFTIGRPSLEVQLLVPERSVVAGTPTTARLGVRNVGSRRHWGSRLDLPVGHDVATMSIRSLAMGQEEWQQFRVPTRRRGVVRIGPAHSVQGDPFALTGRETHWTGWQELFVHPVTVRLPGRQAGFVHDMEGHASPHITAADLNFHALREYVPGDDRRHVHWRSSARTGQLMVRQFEETRQSRVVVALDTGRSAWLDADEFELGVSAAGSVAVQTVLGESPLALLTTGETLAALTPTKALDELCRVELAGRGGVVALVHSTLEREPGASVAVVITGSVATMSQLRAACALFDVDKRVIGLRISAGEPLRVRSVGNITVVQLGSLADLPRAMRKAME